MISKEADFLLKNYPDDNEIHIGNSLSDSGNLFIQKDRHFKIDNTTFHKLRTLTKQCERCYNPSISEHQSQKNNIYDKVSADILQLRCKHVKKLLADVNKEKNMSKEECKTNGNDRIEQTERTENVEEILTAHNKNSLLTEIMKAEMKNPQLTSCPYNCEDIADIINVIPIITNITEREKQLLHKYTAKWKEYVTNKKKEFWYQKRQNTLNTFIDKLKKKKTEINESSDSVNKVKIMAQDYGTYQHRYKVQKHIIALQKAKLEEQTRVIEELKYNKIVDATRQSVDTVRQEVRKAYYEIDRNLKPKIKCLTNELKIPEIDQSALLLQYLKVPQFLQRMEKRAREREEKHAMIRERRRQMEEERLRLKQQAELAKIEMDKEEKLKRIQELRNKRKKEKIENIRRKQFAEKMRALIVMADLHYEKYLMAKYGIRPLKRLIEIKYENIELAKVHYKFQLKKNTFLHFMWYTEDMVFERNYKAEDFYRKKLLMRVFTGLKQMHYDYICKWQVAEDYYDLYVTQLIFRRLREAFERLKNEYDIKSEKCIAYYNSNLLFKTFTCWRTLPALNELKRQQEARKARWREKVLLVVPDYSPPDE